MAGVALKALTGAEATVAASIAISAIAGPRFPVGGVWTSGDYVLANVCLSPQSFALASLAQVFAPSVRARQGHRAFQPLQSYGR
jgi:hypothetical protein